ncbi:glycosyltransferase [Phormidium sp. CCY1219]|uniref:glycosyltransferase n=1 Tax=Phormidium sp. CCY1219 TaxID=2886104 RepID=UPI002D1F39A6|nr:glycosyltransferase [Phormidium sp. CCY1219]MEB3828304.1 tetratricopeptide repeat protein [Phormidium sp. CCY1219]
MKLSLCAIAYNEERTLPKCLESVKTLVDETIVVDTGSSDRTVEIAREFGAQVHHFPWCNDFAAARNESLKYATGDWILVLDADETLIPEIIPQIKSAIRGGAKSTPIPYILIHLIRKEVGATQSPYSLVSRLFRNHPDIQFERPYHAMVDESVERLLQQQSDRWHVGSLNQVGILHEGYQPGAIAERNKFARAREAMESYLQAYPGDAYTCSKLGALYVQSGEIRRGMELLQLGLTSNTSQEPTIQYELHYHLGIACTRQAAIGKAKTHYEKAIAQPILPALKLGAYNNLGNLLLQTGDLRGAIAAYETILQIDPTLPAAHFNLGIALKEKRRLPDAIASYRKAIQFNPDYAEAYQNLGVALLKGGNVLESLDHFRRAIALYEQRQSPAAPALRQSLKEMGLKL